LRTGQRTFEQLVEYERRLFAGRWTPPYGSIRQMTIYGAIQELTTFIGYKKAEVIAREKGDGLLAEIYRLIARDEMAHARFYETVNALLLAEDPDGFKYDLAWVSHHFRMPALDLIPDYGAISEEMRAYDLDRGEYLREVWFPLLKRLGLTRHDLPRIGHKLRAEPA